MTRTEIAFTTFDYAKTFEFWAGQTIQKIELKGRYRNLSEAKRFAKTWFSRNSGGYAKVREIKLKVHELHFYQGVKS